MNHNEYTARVDVQPTGKIVLRVTSAYDRTLKHNWISLSGITFNTAAGTPLTMASGWARFGGSTYGSPDVTCTKGLVVVSGLAKRTSGTSNHIATLPAGCRPSKNLIFSVNHNQYRARVDVQPTGKIVLRVTSAYDRTLKHNWISLSGITFNTAAGTPLTMASGWARFGGSTYGSPDVTCTKGLVVVSGLAKRTSGTSNHIATLPAGCRPSKDLIFSVNHHQYRARVNVRTTGKIELEITDAPGFIMKHNWISLSGITFSAASGN